MPHCAETAYSTTKGLSDVPLSANVSGDSLPLLFRQLIRSHY
jgi:hypothetical protein